MGFSENWVTGWNFFPPVIFNFSWNSNLLEISQEECGIYLLCYQSIYVNSTYWWIPSSASKCICCCRNQTPKSNQAYSLYCCSYCCLLQMLEHNSSSRTFCFRNLPALLLPEHWIQTQENDATWQFAEVRSWTCFFSPAAKPHSNNAPILFTECGPKPAGIQ